MMLKFLGAAHRIKLKVSLAVLISFRFVSSTFFLLRRLRPYIFSPVKYTHLQLHDSPREQIHTQESTKMHFFHFYFQHASRLWSENYLKPTIRPETISLFLLLYLSFGSRGSYCVADRIYYTKFAKETLSFPLHLDEFATNILWLGTKSEIRRWSSTIHSSASTKTIITSSQIMLDLVCFRRNISLC